VFGPTTVGILSDVFQNTMEMTDVESLRIALMICTTIYFVSFINYFFAAKHLKHDLQTVQDRKEAAGL